MAFSFYSNSQHIDFDSVIAMDDQVDFFENASIREDVIISTVAGQLVEISEEWFAESFDLPVDGLGDLSEIPKDVIFDARSIVSLSGEPVGLSGKKNQMNIEYRLLCDILAKSISVKAGSFNAITVEKFSMVTTVVCGVRMNWARVLFNILKKMVTPGSKQAKDFAVQIKEAVEALKPKAASKKRPTADVGAPVVKKKRTMRKKSSSSKANLEIVAVAQETVPIQMVEPITISPAAEDISDQPAGETDGVKAVAADVDANVEKIDEPVAEPSADVETRAGESIEPAVEVPAEDTRPSSADDVDFIIKQVIKDTALMGPAEENQEVDASADRDQPAGTAKEPQWFDLPYDDLISRWDAEKPVVTASDTDEEEETLDAGAAGGDHLPQIPVDAKGKEPLQLKDPIKGKPPQEHYYLICADIDLLVQLREKIRDEVAEFFYSFSLKRLANLQIDDSYFAKEELVFSWAEAESTGVALQRKMYILLKYRALLVRKYLNGWIENFVPGEGDSAVHLKVMSMLSDLLSFVLEELKRQAVAHRIRWTRPCCSILFEANSVCSSFFSVLYRFLDYSLFSRLTTEDISSFVAAIASERTMLRNVQMAQTTVSVAPIVQLLDEHSFSDSSSDAISMDFTAHDTSTTASISLPAAPRPDITEALNQLRASIDQICERDDGAKHRDTLLLHLHNFEKQVIARLDAQDRVLGALRRDSNDQHNLLSLELQSSHKQLGTQIVTTGLDVVDVRRVVRETHQELNARINSLDEQVAATRNDLLEFSAQAQQTLNIITSQLSELVEYINRGGNDKKGEIVSSNRPLPPPVDQIRDNGNAGGRTPDFD
ncbi:hypothetical protein F511_25547 [Dorcoceras hygrometricum]|uniref:Dystroglycan-like n=1 Tax=Dorcoceras hygrometricum TaxID=472368 RepID=A0A2Z7BNC5_9LAMI|nr:hypothetical protein F511_25547 [Dorcoceras hygrometricum]